MDRHHHPDVQKAGEFLKAKLEAMMKLDGKLPVNVKCILDGSAAVKGWGISKSG